MSHLSRHLLASVLALVAVGSSHAAMLGPIGGSGLSGEYASLADSPFSALPFTYFHFEDFEDGVLNVPGVSMSGDGLRLELNDDSVDGDDGVIDGSGSAGRSVWAWGRPGINISFDKAALGQLPTHAGLVWTDGINPIRFEAYDLAGTLIGAVTGDHADSVHGGQTADDRFYGVIHPAGVARIVIYSGVVAGDSGIEIDHLQYALAVPEPTSASLMLAGFAWLGLRLRGSRGCR
ncbi:MAG: hypothetical protein IV092_00110 [Burkholderiaceae bacterium]|nr:hypothetical protein [Burkholderiaceae bacterium]